MIAGLLFLAGVLFVVGVVARDRRRVFWRDPRRRDGSVSFCWGVMYHIFSIKVNNWRLSSGDNAGAPPRLA